FYALVAIGGCSLFLALLHPEWGTPRQDALVTNAALFAFRMLSIRFNRQNKALYRQGPPSGSHRQRRTGLPGASLLRALKGDRVFCELPPRDELESPSRESAIRQTFARVAPGGAAIARAHDRLYTCSPRPRRARYTPPGRVSV